MIKIVLVCLSIWHFLFQVSPYYHFLFLLFDALFDRFYLFHVWRSVLPPLVKHTSFRYLDWLFCVHHFLGLLSAIFVSSTSHIIKRTGKAIKIDRNNAFSGLKFDTDGAEIYYFRKLRQNCVPGKVRGSGKRLCQKSSKRFWLILTRKLLMMRQQKLF